MTQSVFQARVESKERALAEYRKVHFKGSARVHLDSLTFETTFGRQMDDCQNILRLKRILDIQGCLQLNSEFHVPVLVHASDWGRLMLHHDSGESLPELIVPLNYSLHAQDHESLIATARSKLTAQHRWWVVDIFITEQTGRWLVF